MSKEDLDLIQDYKDCSDKIKEFSNENYFETWVWANDKYNDWITKYPMYTIAASGSMNIPADDKLKAWNSINNFKKTLEKIAVLKSIDLDKI